MRRRLPIGAEVQPDRRSVHFRCWAPLRRDVKVEIDDGGRAFGAGLQPEGGGYFSARVADVHAGALYRFRLDDEEQPYPDPASRFQPHGPHGPSQVIDPSTYEWKDAAWPGAGRDGQVIYELHVGTFTREGSWRAAAAQLPELRALGVTVIEVMPVAEFPGRFGWGYDGVDLFAPTHLYGVPDDMRYFVDRAHAAGLGVILDVVYNHLGPDGCYLTRFSGSYFTDRYDNEWGDAINFDGDGSGPVREFFVGNAGHWIDEYHLDGLRLDATQSVHDASHEHVLLSITRRVREAARGRRTIVIGENEPQQVRLLKPPEQGGYGLDALWNDDFHHSALVAVTGRREAYYTDYEGNPQELVSVAKRGYLYQGQVYAWQKKRRGTSTRGIAPAALVTYLQNHDQVANSARGDRLHKLTSPGRFRAITSLMLLLPATPMLFHGQEFAASAPFLYFADHADPLAARVRDGRVGFLAQFRSLAEPAMQKSLADPGRPETFERCKLDFSERESNAAVYRLHRDLLALRHDDPVFSLPDGALDGAVLGAEAFAIRFFSDRSPGERLLLVNLGRDLLLRVAPEPLLAPPEGATWKLMWSTEALEYGGSGTYHPESETGWRLPGHSAVVLASRTTNE